MELISMGTAREELKIDHAACAVLKRKLEAARTAASKARALHGEITRQAAELEGVERRASVSLTDRIKAAIKGGENPSFDRDAAKSAAARNGAEGRRQTSEQVVAELTTEEREAEEAMEAAKNAASDGIRAVMKEEARTLASQWNVAEAAARVAEATALSLRRRLGRFHGMIDGVGLIDDEVQRALRLNSNESYDLKVDRAVTGVWTSFAAALARDADAKPDFAMVDRANMGARQ
jgi:hypothetical protein